MRRINPWILLRDYVIGSLMLGAVIFVCTLPGKVPPDAGPGMAVFIIGGIALLGSAIFDTFELIRRKRKQ